MLLSIAEERKPHLHGGEGMKSVDYEAWHCEQP
jgi:hypothetical protein